MDEQERNDLLIRLDEGVKHIQSKIVPMDCQAHKEKIKIHDKLLWFIVFIVIGVATKTVWASWFAG